ncbi:MAG: AAA domain-containing protein [Firmicutes bacterium]|nr:AAA domain-containing protein [Bacillota bacterium]
MKKIYKYYKERLIEISGKNRSLFSKKVSRKYSYDIGKILKGDNDIVAEFIDFLWRGKKSSFTLVSSKHKKRLWENLQGEVANEKNVISTQVNALRYLKREIEDFARETGRYELFVGYPFVEGSIGRESIVKAPLLLFPVVINIEDEQTVTLEFKENENIQINKVFTFAYAKHHRLNIEDVQLDFESLPRANLKNVDAVLKMLKDNGFKINNKSKDRGLKNFEQPKLPQLNSEIEVKYYAVLGRFPLANSIYNDYTQLEKLNLTTDAIRLLLENKKVKPKKSKTKSKTTKDENTYTISQLDYAQESAIKRLNQSGNLVIYGPPGTGKSQTIVNIIADALCKGKRVLVVSQKKSALDVVYNRLGVLNNKAMYINDPEKNRNNFYEKVRVAHQENVNIQDVGLVALNMGQSLQGVYGEILDGINQEIKLLEDISNTLTKPTTFGISLQKMYAKSRLINKNTGEHKLYEEILKNPRLMELGYKDLNDAVRIIGEKKKCELYYNRLEMQKNNPLVNHIFTDLDVHTLNSIMSYLQNLLSKRIAPFDMGQITNLHQLLGFYIENNLKSAKELAPLIKYIATLENPRASGSALRKREKEISEAFLATLPKVEAYIGEYPLLQKVLDRRGLWFIVSNILNGNAVYIKLLLNALENYANIRDMNINLEFLGHIEKTILDFAYENSSNLTEFKWVINSVLPIRIYHEIVLLEEKYKVQLSNIMEYENIKNRIVSLRAEQKKIVQKMSTENFKGEYKKLYDKTPESNNFLYQINKQQNLWPIRRLVDVYGELLLKLFPCWLLSPENVSTLMPLKANLFDLILFDEASQIFIESTLPTIYRGKHIAVAGDNKQLRPTAMFVRRYMGNDLDDEEDYNTQAALEVESLLDLATSRYGSANLNYHYRSAYEELISFSNYVFYDTKLQIAPNLTNNKNDKPIERVKVDGRWINRKNTEEAKKILELLKKTLKNRKASETIGIITFNSEQESYIADLIDDECIKDNNFRDAIVKERNRKEDGQDVSLFIKNLENVQGDERDIIIFSIGYAKNEQGKVVAQFGPLNLEGGENRLNVAITRAKKKIYVVTSIEPEDLNVENTKHLGPKVFKKYLEYARAVSTGNKNEAQIILDGFSSFIGLGADSVNYVLELKEALEKMGYDVDANLGNNAYKVSLGVYDKELGRYLVGIECDVTAFNSSSSVLERDVFRSKFKESRGWTIIRVWARDWWLSKGKVISAIDKAAKLEKKRLK